MEVMWAPWRMSYIKGESPAEKSCIFCLSEKHQGPDRGRLVLYADDLILVIMNRYPYYNGHLMLAPRRHVATLAEATEEERLALMNWAAKVSEILKKAMNPDGFNFGINQGRVAGAGIEDHLHLHITPRYNGDCNYMTVIGEVRVIPEHILATFDTLLPLFPC